MRYLVSTTVHKITGEQIDSWDGDYIDANSKEEAASAGVKWEAYLREEYDDVTNVKICSVHDMVLDGDIVLFERNGEKFYAQVHVYELDEDGERIIDSK